MSEIQGQAPDPRRRRLLAGGLAGAGAGLLPPARAQVRLDQPPPREPLAALGAPPLAQQRLANGLRVMVLPRPGSARLGLQLMVAAGAAHEPAGREGVIALGMAALARGARRDGEDMDFDDIAYAAESLGAPLVLEGGGQASLLGLALPAGLEDGLGDALALLADLVREPLLSAQALAHARQQAQDRDRLLRFDPAALAELWAPRLAGGAAPVPAAALQRLRREDLLLFRRQYLRPERCTLVLAGELGAQEGLALARALFEDWRPGPAAVPAAPRPAVAPSSLFLDLAAEIGAAPDHAELLFALPPGGDALARRLALELVALRLQPRGADEGLLDGCRLHPLDLPEAQPETWRLQLRWGEAAQMLAALQAGWSAALADAPTPDELARAWGRLQAEAAQRATDPLVLGASLCRLLARGLAPAEALRRLFPPGPPTTESVAAAFAALPRRPVALLALGGLAGRAALRQNWPRVPLQPPP